MTAAQARTLAGNESARTSVGSAATDTAPASSHTRAERPKTCFRNSLGICLSDGRQRGRPTGWGPLLRSVARNVPHVSSTDIVSATTALKLIPLAIFIIAGCTRIDSANFAQVAQPGVDGLGRAAIPALFSFIGMESPLYPS